MATRALIGFITLDPAELIATYNHYDGYPENLGLALENHYDDTVKAKQIAEYGYISYIDPETGNIDAARKEAPSRTDLMVGWEDAMYEIAKEIDSFGADYAYIWNEDESSWVTIKHYGVRSTMDQLANALQAYQGEFGDNMADLPAAPDQVAEDFNTKWKKFLNEESPLYNDMGDVSDTIYDYADRMLGAGVDDVEDLIMYYKNNPDEIPEPMDAKFFVQYADEIAQAVNDQERWEGSDLDTDY